MQYLVVVPALVILSVVCNAAPQEKTTYSTKWDSIDLDEILNSDRLLNNYVKCLLGTGSCTPDGSDLKQILPEALKDDCAKCTENQKKGAEKVVRFLIKNKPDSYKDISAKFDPTGIYKSRRPELFA